MNASEPAYEHMQKMIEEWVSDENASFYLATLSRVYQKEYPDVYEQWKIKFSHMLDVPYCYLEAVGDNLFALIQQKEEVDGTRRTETTST